MRRLHDAILWCLSLALGHDVGYSSENCARLGLWDRPPIYVAGPRCPCLARVQSCASQQPPSAHPTPSITHHTARPTRQEGQRKAKNTCPSWSAIAWYLTTTINNNNYHKPTPASPSKPHTSVRPSVPHQDDSIEYPYTTHSHTAPETHTHIDTYMLKARRQDREGENKTRQKTKRSRSIPFRAPTTRPSIPLPRCPVLFGEKATHLFLSADDPHRPRPPSQSSDVMMKERKEGEREEGKGIAFRSVTKEGGKC